MQNGKQSVGSVLGKSEAKTRFLLAHQRHSQGKQFIQITQGLSPTQTTHHWVLPKLISESLSAFPTQRFLWLLFSPVSSKYF